MLFFRIDKSTVCPSAQDSASLQCCLHPCFWPHPMDRQCLLHLCAPGQSHLTVVNPTVCKSWEFAGTGAERSFPLKVALNKRKALCFSVWFIRKALEPLCPLGCRAGQGTGRAAQSPSWGYWDVVYSSLVCRSRGSKGPGSYTEFIRTFHLICSGEMH